MPELGIQLLGDFQLTYDGKTTTALNQPRLQSLLAYLVLHRAAPQSRQHLALAFWPDLPAAQMRNNLRQLLFQLRHALPHGSSWLISDSSAVWWSADAPIRLDVAEYERALDQAAAALQRSERAAAVAALEQAVQTYAGDLLPSCYDEWVQSERERLHQCYVGALSQLVLMLEEMREYGQALGYAQRLLQADPLREETSVTLMRLHALGANRAGALRVYHQTATLLQVELGVEPGERLRGTYMQLLAPAEHEPPEALREASAVPLVGRQAEWQRLRATWQRAAGGQALLVLISGEAGIGKTRLGDELLTWAARQGVAGARTRAYAAEGQLPYAAISEWLRSGALRGALRSLDDIWACEIARLLPELLADRPHLKAPGPLTERWQRQRFFQALARAVLAGDAPLMLHFDDLQWADQETLEWLHFLLRSEPGARLLLVGTLRVEDRTDNAALAALLPALRRSGQLVEISLASLDAAETARLASLVAGREVGAPEAHQLFSETEGNPLFITEMVRAQSDSSLDAREAAPSAVRQTTEVMPLPPAVYALIAGRLGLLSPPAAQLLRVAATIGRSFTVEVLAQSSGQREETLVAALDELWQRRVVREQGVNTYDFSHDKLRDVAYREMSPIQRRTLHGRVALALERVYADDLDQVSAQLAAHFEQSGQGVQALGYYERAAHAAQRVFAHAQAVQLLRQGLTLLPSIAAGRTRELRELALQTARGASLVAIFGYSSEDAASAYHRAYAICERLGEPPSPPVLRGLALAHIVRAESQQAYALGEQILQLAQLARDPVLLVEAQYVQGVALTWQGQFGRANEHLTAALAHYDPRQTRTHLALYAQDPQIVCRIRLAANLWILGYPEQAERGAQEALMQARALGHPFSLAYAHYYDTQRLAVLRATELVRAASEATIALCRDYQINYWASLAMICAGWAEGRQGAIARGTARLRQGIAQRDADRTRVGQPLHLALLAELYSMGGDVARAMETLAAGLAMADATGEQWYTAELHRMQGELLQDRDPAAGERELRRALAVASSQGARSFELRAATSLARLWRKQGRADDARALLAPIYGWFREGLATPDLVAARSLLENVPG